MILWLGVIGAVLMTVCAATWMVYFVNRDRVAAADVDRNDLPDDQLGL